jgi:predicted ATP-dependent endonuclease of OLD family
MANVNTITHGGLVPSLKFKNTILVGDNASAKTYALETLLQNQPLKAYYISVYNRSIEQSKLITEATLTLPSYREQQKLLANRTNVNANEDILWDGSLGSNFFASLLNHDKFRGVIEDFFDSKIDMHHHNSPFVNNTEIRFNGVTHLKLSNGLSSIFRILLELEVAKLIGCETVYIDEIEQYLDSQHSFKLIKFIQSRYNSFNLIITTHSDDVIVGSNDFNVIKINNDSTNVEEKSIEIYDGNDYDSSLLAKRKFFQIDEDSTFTSVFVKVNRIYDSLLISDNIGQNDIDYLNEIERSDLPEKILNVISEIKFLRSDED